MEESELLYMKLILKLSVYLQLQINMCCEFIHECRLKKIKLFHNYVETEKTEAVAVDSTKTNSGNC